MQTRVKFISLLIAGVVSPLLTMSPATPFQQTTPGPAEPSVVSPSAAVQKSLDRAAQYAQAKQPLYTLNAADEALSMSKEKHDSAGEALAHRARARALTELNRKEEAAATWQAAAGAWEHA